MNEVEVATLLELLGEAGRGWRRWAARYAPALLGGTPHERKETWREAHAAVVDKLGKPRAKMLVTLATSAVEDRVQRDITRAIDRLSDEERDNVVAGEMFMKIDPWLDKHPDPTPFLTEHFAWLRARTPAH